MKSKYLIIPALVFSSCAQRVVPEEIALKSVHQEERSRTASIQLSNIRGRTSIVWEPTDPNEEFIIEYTGSKLNTFNVGLSGERMAEGAPNYPRFNESMRSYSKAQFYLYRKEYDSALYAINTSIDIMQTSEALALKGSILYIKGMNADAEKYWKKAREIDSTIVIPEIEN